VTRIRRNPAPTGFGDLHDGGDGRRAAAEYRKGLGKHRSNRRPGRLSFAPVGSGRMAPLPRLPINSAAAKWALRPAWCCVWPGNSFWA